MTEIAVPRQAIAAAALALAHAGRWRDAAALLDAAAPEDPAAHGDAAAPRDPVLALTAAQVAIESDWFAGTSAAHHQLTLAAPLAPELDDQGRWDLAFVDLRDAYRAALMPDRSTRAPVPADALSRRAAELAGAAPDAVREGWAEMYRGLINDNVLDKRDAAEAHYLAALEAGAGDPFLAREALRHLGDHDRERGDHQLALRRWRRATELGAAAGNVPGTLSQQLLLALLARDAGDEAGAVALATETARWAAALGATSLAERVVAFIDGADPTALPPAPPTEPEPSPPAPVMVSFMTAPLATTPRQ